MDEVVIRKTKFNDLIKVSEIVISSWKTAYRGIIADEYLDSLTVEQNYQKRVNDYNENNFVVAELNGEIVGFCRFRFENVYNEKFPEIDCELCALYVKPDYKGKGIGKKLINYVINNCKSNGYKKMILWCFKDNYPSRMFYEKTGGIYGGEDVIVRGDKPYKKVCYIYDLEKLPKDELELVFPSEKYRKQVEEYLQEFLDNNEYDIPGDGGLDKIKDFDEWLKKVQNDVSENIIENEQVPATVYLTVRKSDNRIVGNVQIRHFLNESLLKYGGHIGDAVRPSERKKGYATEQIRLALKKCKELGIDNVLMDCNKLNVGSAKSIKNNGGILENEVIIGDKCVQRYWISLKKRYAYKHLDGEKNVICKSIFVDTSEFSGDIYFYYFKNVTEKYILPSGTCIIDNDYKWLEFYDCNDKIKLSVMYDDKDNVIEWYFDITRRIEKDNGIPYEDDLYLDVLVKSNGEIKLLDEDELELAHEKFEVTDKDYEMAYKKARELMKRLENSKNELKEFTDKYLYKMMKN